MGYVSTVRRLLNACDIVVPTFQFQTSGLAGLQGASLAGTPSARTSSKPTTPKPIQKGGAVDELSTESQILGAAVFAIIGGGVMKAVVDNLI